MTRLIPIMSALRVLRQSLQLRPCQADQIRYATLLRRPKRPYTFTQLVTLSDGSAFTIRTTSPQPVYKSAKDTRNTPLWNPSSQKLMNVEEDEAGRLASFRSKFGKGWDSFEKDKTTNDQLADLISGQAKTAAKSSSTPQQSTKKPSSASEKPAPKK